MCLLKELQMFMERLSLDDCFFKVKKAQSPLAPVKEAAGK